MVNNLSVRDLTEEQLDELKNAMFWNDEDEEIMELVGEAETPYDIPNEAVFKVYENTAFVMDDFGCSAKDYRLIDEVTVSADESALTVTGHDFMTDEKVLIAKVPIEKKENQTFEENLNDAIKACLDLMNREQPNCFETVQTLIELITLDPEGGDSAEKFNPTVGEVRILFHDTSVGTCPDSDVCREVIPMKDTLFILWVKNLGYWIVYHESKSLDSIRFFDDNGTFETATQVNHYNMARTFCNRRGIPLAMCNLVVDEVSTRDEALKYWETH